LPTSPDKADEMNLESLQIQFGRSWRQWKEEISCHDLRCRSSHRVWRRVSVGARGVHVYGRRYCFPACFERELQHRLERMPAPWQPRTHGAHRIPLGLLMLSRGDLDGQKLKAAIEAQRRSGTGRIGEWIEKLGFAREQQVTAALAAQWSCPVLWKFPEHIAESAVPFPLLRRFCMAPAYYAQSTRIAYIAFAGPIEYQALLAIEQVLECRAEACMTSSNVLNARLARLEQESRPCDHIFENTQEPEAITRIVTSYAAKLQATDLRLSACGEHIWCRLEAEKNSTNLLFGRPAADTLALA
jgi:hypothetical protein